MNVTKIKEGVASVKTKEEKPPVKTKKMTKPASQRQARAQDGAEVGTQDCNARKER